VTSTGPVNLPTAADTADFGRRLAGVLRAGDLVVLAGGLGAGKTTLTQGLGAGLGVRGDVTSPTFVIARVHRSLGAGPDLVHVDAYRLGSVVEVDDLDLDASLPDSVTVVEWGAGRVEGLAEDRLVVELLRAEGVGADVTDQRTVTVTAVGDRWAGSAGTSLAEAIRGQAGARATP
jgi:tRNA threonylcarbamoyladenosine biosynthesis protein TsaE